MARLVALSGTPGTGKSSVARALASRIPSVEVGDLAARLESSTGRGREREVDLVRLSNRLRASSFRPRAGLVVGHLAHLLPIQDTVVLRCSPAELAVRLARAGRGTRAQREANIVAEATDLILFEALARRRRIWEVDTSGRDVVSVARQVASIFRSRPPARYGDIDWLSDPSVTEHLLRSSR